MSSNTNTLFWVITGAVIVLGIFLLVNTTSDETLGNINNKFEESASSIINYPILEEYYSHVKNYHTLVINSEKDFTFESSTGTIKSYKGDSSTLVIPPKINGVVVKKIDKLGVSNVTTLILPNTIEEIKSQAFYNCNLEKVVFPNSLITIGGSAFANNKLIEADISNLTNLTTIGAFAFDNNNLSGHLIVPDSVVDFGGGAYSDNNLESVQLSKNQSKLDKYSFSGNRNMKYAIFRNPRMYVFNYTNTSDVVFDLGSDFVIKIPVGTTSWFRQFPNLEQYILEEVQMNE